MALLYLLLLFHSSNYSPLATGPTMVEIRNMYVKAVHSRQDNAAFLAVLEKQPLSPVIKGYKGGAHFIAASHALAPWNKWSEFKAGKKILESAIAQDPAEPELRFIRLSIQSNLPGFLHYSSNISQDTEFLKSALPGIYDQDLRKRIISWFIENHKP